MESWPCSKPFHHSLGIQDLLATTPGLGESQLVQATTRGLYVAVTIAAIRIWRGSRWPCYKCKALKNGKTGRETACNLDLTGNLSSGSIFCCDRCSTDRKYRKRMLGFNHSRGAVCSSALTARRNSHLDARPSDRHRPCLGDHRLLVSAGKSRGHQHGPATLRPGTYLHQQICVPL